MELENRLWNEVELAKHLNLTVACVRRWRLGRYGPEWRKLGRAVRYSPKAVQAWLESRPVGGDHQAEDK